MHARTLFAEAACATILACVAVAPVHAVSIVVPSGNAAIEGNSNNSFPFDLTESQRYQQIYEATEFGVGPHRITEMMFRPDSREADLSFAAILPDIQINLSTTTKGPGTLSPMFADNVGPDDTIVIPRGPLSLSSNDTGPADLSLPRDFDILIAFATPFLYDPSQGNLLLDVRNFQGEDTNAFDAQTPGGTSSRLFSTLGNVDAEAGNLSPLALVTKFTLEPVSAEVPEPATLALLLIGICGIAARPCRRRHPDAPRHRPADGALRVAGAR